MLIGDLAWVTSPSTFALAGLIALALLVYRAIVRGTLVPRATMDLREADWEKRLADQQKVADERLAQSREDTRIWRTAHGESESARLTQAQLIDQLTVMGQTTLAILQALPTKDRT